MPRLISSALLLSGAPGARAPPPLVFLSRNNDFMPGSAKQEFADGVHWVKEEEIDKEMIWISGNAKKEAEGRQRASNVAGGGGGGDREDGDTTTDGDINRRGGGGIFVVDDNVSLYRKMACYRIDTSVHYHEPVKLMEAKMLWDLISLVDREKNANQ